MTQRVIDGSTYNLTYDYENHLTGVSGAKTATFVYDGDGNRVKGTVNGTTVAYIGSHFEWAGSTSTMIKYYYETGTRVAMRVGSSTLYYLLTDHLGSTTITANSSGALSSERRYMPWGEERYTNGSTPTTYRYTGQREEFELGIYFYQSRWYDPRLSRFLQADTIVPDPYNSQAWDRFAYALNAPTRYTDPTGHWYYDPGCDCLVYTGNPGNEHPENLFYIPDQNKFDFTNIHVWAEPNPQLSIRTQDLATIVSTSGALIETGATIAGCAAEPGPGCVVGWSFGNGFYQVVMNPIESTISYFSAFLSITYDLATGNIRFEDDVLVLGESSTTSVVTSAAGSIVPIGIVDAVIDNYASEFNHGKQPSIFGLLGIKGKTLNLGFIKIQFGKNP